MVSHRVISSVVLVIIIMIRISSFRGSMIGKHSPFLVLIRCRITESSAYSCGWWIFHPSVNFYSVLSKKNKQMIFCDSKSELIAIMPFQPLPLGTTIFNLLSSVIYSKCYPTTLFQFLLLILLFLLL